MSNHHFHRSAGPFIILLFYYSISIRFQAEVVASRVAKPECRTTIFTGRPDRSLFHYFTIVVLCFFIILLFSDFTTLLFHYFIIFSYFAISFSFGSRKRFLHLGSRNVNVEPQFSPVGRTLPVSFFSSRTANPCMSAHVFACRPNASRARPTHQHYRNSCRHQISMPSLLVCRASIAFPHAR